MQKQRSEIPQQFPHHVMLSEGCVFACGKSCEVFRAGVVSFLGMEMRPRNGSDCEAAGCADLDITFDQWVLPV